MFELTWKRFLLPSSLGNQAVKPESNASVLKSSLTTGLSCVLRGRDQV